MAQVLLIQPPWSLFQGSGFNELPSGICSLSNYLNQRGHETWVFNADYRRTSSDSVKSLIDHFVEYKRNLQNPDHPIWEEIQHHIKEKRPDIVGIHFKTGAIKSVQRVARIVRDTLPNCLVVVGGPHPSILAEEIVTTPEFDLVVRGEGEESLFEIAERIPFSFTGKIPGVVYQDREGHIIDGGYRPFSADINELCKLDRKHLIDGDKYNKNAFGIMFSARGCPFQCTYCQSKAIWTRKVRYRSSESFVSEMEHVYKTYGTTFFNIRDDTFTLNRKRSLEICKQIEARLPSITWSCDTRADCIDFELAQSMRRAGCIRACIGLESGSNRILKMVKKGETAEQIACGVKLLQQAQISCAVFIMMGFPTETVQEVEETVDFAIGLKPSSITLSIVTPYPCSELYEQTKQLGLLPDTVDYSDYFHQSPRMNLMNMDSNEFLQLTDAVAVRISRYNSNMMRRIKQFLLIFSQNPRGAINRTFTYGLENWKPKFLS